MEGVILVEQELCVIYRIDTFFITYNKHGTVTCISLDKNVNKKKENLINMTGLNGFLK